MFKTPCTVFTFTCDNEISPLITGQRSTSVMASTIHTHTHGIKIGTLSSDICNCMHMDHEA